MWRILKIAALFTLLLLLLMAAALLVWVRSDAFDQWARSWIVGTIEDRFNARVELGSVDVRLLGTEVNIYNLKLFNRVYPVSEPAIDVDHILLDFSFTHFFLPSISLDRLLLDRPRIRLVEDANRRLNFSNMFLPATRRKTSGFSFTALAIKRLVLNRGLILYQRRPLFLDSAEGGMIATLQFFPEQKKYVGHTSFEPLNLAVNGFIFDGLTASLDFEFLENEFRVLSLQLDSPVLAVHATGHIGDLRDFVYRFESDVSVDLAQLEAPDLRSHFQKGLLSLSGTFSGTRGDFSFQGEARSALVQFENFPFRQIEASIDIDPKLLTVKKLHTLLYGGSVRAEGTLSWKEDDDSQFRIAASQVSIYPLLSDLGQGEIRSQGSADFSGRVHWPGLQWSKVTGQGRLSYQGNFSSQGLTEDPIFPALPFEGNSMIFFGNQAVRSADGLLRTPQSMINYHGQASFGGNYQFEFDLASRQSKELLNLARHTGVPEKFIQENFLNIKGPTLVSAALQGSKGQFRLSGTVHSERVFLNNELLGDFESQVTFDGSRLQFDDARIVGPTYRLRTSLHLALDLPEVGLLEALELQLNEVPIERFLSITEQAIPVEGRVTGQLQLEQVGFRNYQGSGRISVLKPRAYREGLDDLSAKVEIEGRTILLEEIQGSVQEGTVSGRAAVNLEDETYVLNIQGFQFPLKKIQALQKRIPAQGRVNFTLQGAGGFRKSDFELLLEGPQIVIGEYGFENMQLQAIGRGDTLDFLMKCSFLGNPFLFNGQVGLVEPYPVAATLELKQFPLHPYVQLISARNLPDIGGFVTGRLTLAGPLKDPTTLAVDVALLQLKLSVAGYELHNTGPVKLSYQGRTLSIDHLNLSGAQTELQIVGAVDLGENRSVNLEMKGMVNLLAFNSFLASGTTAGQLQLQTVMAGPLSKPRIVGTAQLEEGFLVHPDFPTPIFDAEGNLRFTANQISLQSFSAETIYGRVNAEGGIFLEGFKPTRWQINVFGNGLRLEYPRNTVSTLDVDLDLVKSEVSELISGAVYVRAADYTQNISIPQLIFEYAQSEIAPLPAASGQEVALGVTVEAYQSLRVKNNLVDAVASADLNIRGTVQNPVILGTISVDEGNLYLEHNEYEISRGTVNFNNPRRTRPALNFEAQTEVREFTVSVVVQGPLDRLNFSFRSDPPLPTPSIVSLLAVGQTQEEIFGPEGDTQSQFGTLAAYGAGTLLSKSVGEKLEARTSRLFGFEKFSIDPFLFGSERDPGARITLGKQLTKDLSLSYSTNLGSDQQGQIVVFEYRMTDWLTAVGTKEQDGSIALDFKLKKRF
ncbi:MAG: translocation/assembly module TamB domain-containing protein [Acidobacteriota bacterium]